MFYKYILHHRLAQTLLQNKYCFPLSGQKHFSQAFSWQIRPPMKRITSANSFNVYLKHNIKNEFDLLQQSAQTNLTHLFRQKLRCRLQVRLCQNSASPQKTSVGIQARSESAQMLCIILTNIHAFLNSHFPSTGKRPGQHYAHFWQPLFCEANGSIIYMTKDSLRIYYFLLLFVIKSDK